MNKTLALAICLLAAVLAPLPAPAQTLADALEQAWLRHPQASALAARVAEAEARAELTAALTPGPATLSLGHLNDGLTSNRGKREWEVELATPLWLPGQKAVREAEAASALGEIAARRTALRLEIAGEVRAAWWALAAARDARDLGLRRIATARALEVDVLRRYKAGDLARVDGNLAGNERLAAEADLIETETAQLQAEQAYHNLTGAAAPAVLAAEAAAPARAPQEGHPRLTALSAVSRLARAKLNVARESRRDAPELAVRVLRERADFSDTYANAVGVKLSIPFSSGPRVRQENAAARAEVDQAEAELALARQKLALDAEKARLDLDAAQRQLAMTATRRELTADNLRLAEKAFSLGESDLTALLRARAAAFEADALLNRQQVASAAAKSRLKQALGDLP